MVKIKKIDIRVGNKIIRLTAEQATEMQSELNRVFPLNVPVGYPYIIPWCPCPQPVPQYPEYPIITWTTAEINLSDYKGIYCTTIVN